MELTVVIICRNEADSIGETILAAQKLTNKIVVVDTGSTDQTLEILKSLSVQIISSAWLGFGPTKNLGIAHATTDWILSIDADERIDAALIKSIQAIETSVPENIYAIKFLNYLGKHPLHYGEWGNDKHLRLFHKKNVAWNNAEVHEALVMQQPPQIITLQGYIHHSTSPNRAALHDKMDGYAKLNAQHYFQKGKKNATLKVFISPVFNFVQNYIFKLGFLDGKAGLEVALENASYTYKKYHYLKQLNKKNK